MGGLLLVVGLVLLLLGIDGLGDWHARSRDVLILVLAGFTVLTMWARHEARHPFPLIDVKVLADRRIALTNIGMFLVALGPMQSNIVMPLLMQQPVTGSAGLGLSGTLTGSVMMATMMAPLAGGPWAGYLAARRSGRVPLCIGIVLVALGCLLLAFHFNTLWWLVLALWLQALGIALVLAGTPMVLIESAPGERVSEIVSMASVLRQLALALGAQSMMRVLSAGDVSTGMIAGSRFHLSFAVMTGIAGLACLLIVFIPGQRTASAEFS